MKRPSDTFRAILCLSLAASLAGAACSHRWRVVDETPDGGPPVADAATDGLLPWPDGPVPDYTAPSSPCKEISPTNPDGHKPVTLRRNTTGDWLAALDKTATYGDLAINTPAAKMAAAALDYRGADQEVAGFILSRDTKLQDIQDRNSTAVSSSGEKLSGDELAAYLEQMEKRLEVTRCLGAEAKAARN